jgi:O-antigen biosynthesis protein
MSRKNKTTFQGAILDVVIITAGRFDMLSKCLDALYREAETVPLNIFILDNDSPKEERSQNAHLFVKREGSKVQKFSVEHVPGLGYAAANNVGARRGNASFIMFLNDDVELHEGAILKLLEPFQEPTIGVVGIKLLFPPTSTSSVRPAGKVQHVGMGFNVRGDAVHPLVGWSADHPKTNVSKDVISVTGACLTIRRNLFNKIGGFSLEYGFGTWEDVDLCFKARVNKFRIWVTTQAVGYHYTGATAEKKRIGYPMQQNRSIFQVKWGNSGLMSWTDFEFL